ncbi:MAG TPA: DUF6259 domain-containing protein [Chthonomonadales bacterium]|nr:DUF6259 domain-containing protein [Chthonomonadales bacterium]
MLVSRRADLAALIALACLTAAPVQAAEWPAMELSTRSVDVVVRGATVTALTNRLTGETLARSNENGWTGQAGVQRIGRPDLRDAAADRVNARRDGASVLAEAGWREGGATEAASMRTRFAADPATGDIVVTQTASAASKGVAGVTWCLGDVPDTLEVLVPGHSGQRFGQDTPVQAVLFDYPTGWEAQFVLLQGANGGIMVWAEDTAPRFKNLTVEKRPGLFRLRFETRAFAPFEDKAAVHSVRWRITAYQGDWQVAAARYREWAERAFSLRRPWRLEPAWARDIRFVVIVSMDIPTLGALAARVDPRQTLLYVPNWRRHEYDRMYPDYTAAPQFGPFVREAHRLGFRVMPHVNYFGCDPNHPLYERFRRWQMRDPVSGELQWWDWARVDPPIRFAYINPALREWRRLFVQKMVELVRRYRVDALHLDQTLVMVNDANGLIDGMSSMQGNIALHRELRAALPNVALSGEGLNEVTYRYQAFAQRHVRGIHHVDATWNDRLIAMAHPISSAVLLPRTAMYGFLGLSNPRTAPAKKHAWLRAYERLGVLPTLAWPDVAQLEARDPGIEHVLAEARFFQQWKPRPDVRRTESPDELFAYTLSDGSRARYRRDRGTVFERVAPDGTISVISRRIEGVGTVEVDGSIPGWLAYDAQRIHSLDPRRSYFWSPAPRNLAAPHVAELPRGYLIAGAGVHDRLIRLRLEAGPGAEGREEIALWERTHGATAGVLLAGDILRTEVGGHITDEGSGGRVEPEGEWLFMHPPWKGPRATHPPERGAGLSFVEYRLHLPNRRHVRLTAAVRLRQEAAGKSDGVAFRMTVTSGVESLTERVLQASGQPRALTMDISDWRGREAVVRLEIGAGPAGDPTFDWAMVERPRIEAHDDPGRALARVRIAGVASYEHALVAQGDVRTDALSDGRVDARLTLPNTLLLVRGSPTGVAAPFDLLRAPFQARSTLPGGVEQEPEFPTGVSEAACGGVTRPALHQHPPSSGETLVDYWLRLPDAPVHLRTAVGLRDGSRSTGAGFGVEVNGRRIFWQELMPGSGWQPVEVSLEPWRGQDVVLTLVTGALADYLFDWCVWAEPRLE